MPIEAPPPPPPPPFWGTQNEDPPNPVIDETPGDTKEIPYHYLPGSDVGVESVNTANAAALFPTYGIDNPLPPPENDPQFLLDFAKDPDELSADVFLKWHSAYQLEYIATKGTIRPVSDVVIDDQYNSREAVIGINGQTITAVLSSDGLRVYIVENLQKRDLATIDRQTQLGISATPAFAELASRFGLISDRNVILNGDPNSTVRNEGINDIKQQILNLFPGDEDLPDGQKPAAMGLMTYDDREVFMDRINNIITRVNNMQLFSYDDIMKEVREIAKRFERAFYFGQVVDESSGVGGDSRQWTNVISTDNGATVKNGYRVFVEQEKKMLELDNARMAIANTGMLSGKNLDVPTLVFLLQLHYNLTVEAKSTAEVEEINQQNALLRTYGEMQRLINETTKNFDHGNVNDSRALKGQTGWTLANITSVQEQKILSMFEDLTSGQLHPLERMKQGFTRPRQDMFVNGGEFTTTSNHALQAHKKGVWEGYGQTLADAVTLLSQDSQITMNDVNSLDKQKNRHFDLANGALQKLSEILNNIARSTS